MPSPETAGNQAPFGFPLLDVNNNNAVAYMTNWPQWCNFRCAAAPSRRGYRIGLTRRRQPGRALRRHGPIRVLARQTVRRRYRSRAALIARSADIAVQMNYTTYAAMATAWGVDYMGFCIQGQCVCRSSLSATGLTYPRTNGCNAYGGLPYARPGAYAGLCLGPD
jgi:hypothetical protein